MDVPHTQAAVPAARRGWSPARIAFYAVMAAAGFLLGVALSRI